MGFKVSIEIMKKKLFMVHLIKNKIKDVASFSQLFISSTTVKIGLYLNLPLLVAIGWRLAMRPSFKAKAKFFGRRKLVVLAKSAGVQDIESAYLKDKANYAVLFLPRSILVLSANVFRIQERVTSVKYHSNDKQLEKDKEKYRDHFISVLYWFKKIFGVSTIIQFNIIYSVERELANACSQSEINFVTLHKECNWSPGNVNSLVNLYSQSVPSYSGNAIAVYNLKCKDIFVKSKIIDEKLIHVVGCARLDESHRMRLEHKKLTTSTVLYYLIEPIAGPLYTIMKDGSFIPGIKINDGSIVTWFEMIKTVNNALIELASDNTDINFICEGKANMGDEQAKILMGASGLSSLPNNIQLITDGIGHKLIQKASVVIGFNTTAVFEAIAAGVPTIVPNIFSKSEQKIIDYTHQVNDGVQVPKTVKELKNIVLKTLENGTRSVNLSQGQKKTLDRLVGNSDGKSGERFRRFLDSTINCNPAKD